MKAFKFFKNRSFSFKYSFGLLLGMTAINSVHAQHLWWNDPGCGDIMEMMVYVSNTATTTYYETLGWNQGANGGGYTGIQTDANMKPTWIFSLWNPNTTTRPIKAIYVNPQGTVSPFGGEGTGMKYFNTLTGWNLNNWYRQVIRSWQYNGDTYYAMWSYDVNARTWMHHITFDYPLPNLSFCASAVSFLENWGGTTPTALRHASFTGGWKRINNQWTYMNTATVDGSLSNYGRENIGQYSTVFMQTGQPTTNTTNPLKISFTIPPYTVDNGKKYIPSENIVLDTCGNKLTYNWIVDVSQNPQFSYKIVLIDNRNQAVLKTSQDVNPDTRSVTFDLTNVTTPKVNLAIKATITDIYDVPHTN